MHTHRVDPGIQQDPIRLKNLLGEAEKRLIDAGMRSPEARSLLEPAHRLLLDGLFWRRQSDGLALFLSFDKFQYYRLPLAFEELVVASQRFHIKPLLPLFSGDGRFYILAISQNRVRFLQGSRYSVGEIDLDDVPTSLAAALRFDDPEKRLQFHTATAAPGGHEGRAAAFHGHGVGTNDAKTNILRYFQKVSAGVNDLLREEQAPMVLAGVDYLLPIYREASNYPFLTEEGIEGNPEELSAEELHRQAWVIAQPRFLQDKQGAIARYLQLAGTSSELASGDLKTVLKATYHGRVDTLFVALGVQRWGAFHPDLLSVEFHNQRQPGDQDLLDLVAVQTLLNGGKVYAVGQEQVPTGSTLAAVFRY
jgi:hypothetical protein